MQNAPKSRLRFSLRALLLVFTVAAVGLAVPVWHAQSTINAESEAARRIQELGGTCVDEYVPPKTKWLVTLLGKEYYTYVNRVDLEDSSVTEEDVLAMMPYIAQFRLNEQLSIDEERKFVILNYHRDPRWKKVFEEYKEKLPHCVFLLTQD